MYSNEKKGFSILDIIVKMILFGLFIFILVWLFNKKVPNMTPFYSNVFRENIKYMQEAAESYFTDDKMPQEVGGEVKMTLSEMLEKKLLLPFVDKDGKSCDLTNSYVTITKQPDESWILKTNLECGSEKDYTIKVLGCHNYCKDNNCEKVCKIEQLTSYQYKKQVTTTNTKYSCKSGYTLNGKYCYKTVVADTKSAEKTIVDYKTYTEDALVKVNKGTTTYSCPSGYTAEGSGSSLKCYKKVTSYSCPSGYTAEGSGSSLKCYKNVTSYSCPSGYTAEGSGSSLKCYKNVTSYSCPSGYTAEGSGSSLKCYKNVTSYSCPSGYTAEGSGSSLKCYKNVTSYSCPSGYTAEGSGSSLKCYKNVTSYSCPSGYTAEGSGSSLKCYKNVTSCSTYTAKEAYSCNCTGHWSGGQYVTTCSTCYKDVQKETCSTSKSYTDKVTSTSKSYTDKVTSTSKSYTDKVTTTTKSYTDKITTTSPDTYTYYCKDSSWTLSGKKCTKTVKETSIKYECPSDYKLEGTVCKKYKTDKVAAEATKTTSKSWKYTWSTKTSLDGWTRTGKTKTVEGKQICE